MSGIFQACHGSRLTARNTSHHPDNSDHRNYREQLNVDIPFYPIDAERNYSELAGESPHPSRAYAVGLDFAARRSQKQFY